MLSIKKLYCGYDGIDVVKDVNFQVEQGQILSIVGPNGCGKTTILKAIANLIDYRGDILLEDNQLRTMKRNQLAKKIAIMTQSADIYFPYTVFETVALGRYAHLTGIFSTLSKTDNEMILNCIENVGLIDYKDKLISELSGGQLQRVYLARAFAQDPDILLLDEPTNHLDLKYQIEILYYINKWTKDHNKTVVGVLHDLNLVQMFSEEVIMIKDGQIVKTGKPHEVFEEELLKEVYDINIKSFMLEALEKWK
ncbi:MAG: ABC transporter ATP-binding protein [Turicibacter sp.]